MNLNQPSLSKINKNSQSLFAWQENKIQISYVNPSAQLEPYTSIRNIISIIKILIPYILLLLFSLYR